MSFIIGLLIGLSTIAVLKIDGVKAKTRIMKSCKSSLLKKPDPRFRLLKISKWCEDKYKKYIVDFRSEGIHPDASEILVHSIAEAGSILYLRACGMKFHNNNIKCLAKSQQDLIQVIRNDIYLLFVLGEEAKQIEAFPTGAHKEKALYFYTTFIANDGWREAWAKLKVDVYALLHSELSEIDKNLKQKIVVQD